MDEPLQNPAATVDLEKLIGRAQDLPSLPEIYLRVSEQLEDESVKVHEIGSTVQNDPAITTRVLRMVNSAYYGLPNQVSSIEQAIGLLGRERLKHILIGSILRGVFAVSDDPAFSMEAFWKHCVKTAIIARDLAHYIDPIETAESMFTAGLLHDIGRLVLIKRFPEELIAAERHMLRKRIGVVEAERDKVGVTHTEVGEALMRRWGLPQMLIDTTRLHHQTVHDGEYRHATHLIYLANRLSEYVPPLDDDETRDILDDIENWDNGMLGIQEIGIACQLAEDRVFEVMESLGMITIEI